MLTTKRINVGLAIISKALRFFIIFYTAMVLAKGIWWLLTPARNNIFIEWADLDKQDKATSYINNRYPFGVIVVTKPKEPPKPKIADLLKLTGVYLNTDKDSFAFLEYEGKALVARIGEKVPGTDAVLKSINVNSIEVTDNDEVATINLSSGSASTSAGGGSGSPVGDYVGHSPSQPNSMFSNVRGDASENDNASNQQSLPQNTSDFKERRKKMIQDFIKQDSRDRSESLSGNNH